jgi:hypothetical protein
MVDELFQGWGGQAGTANAIMSSNDYISQAQRSLGNIEDGFYISPAFLDKLSIHIAKNFMDLPKIKVPLILGIWGGKGQVRRHTDAAAAAAAAAVWSTSGWAGSAAFLVSHCHVVMGTGGHVGGIT